MEQVHGVDVSWMTRGSPRDKFSRSSSSHASPPRTPQPRSLPPPVPSARNPEGTADVSAAASAAANGQSNGTPGAGHPNGHPNGQPDGPPSPASSTPKRLSRSGSADRLQGPNGSAPQRRNSWFSNISAKFSGSSSSPQNNAAASHHSNHHLHLKDQQHPSAQNQEPQSPLQSPSSQPQSPNSPSDPLPPKLHAARNAVLQHAARPDGNGPYTPAPPKSGQAGILGVFRRLSSSGTAGLAGGKMGNGLVERITLNVDQNRKRCPIPELKDAKLRRVSFCVDVEIAPMPKYADADVVVAQPANKPADKSARKKLTDKGEGEALKNPKAATALKAPEPIPEHRAEPPQAAPSPAETPQAARAENAAPANGAARVPPPPEPDKDGSKKKEKKKKSEEERKARKEKRRRLAEDNGSVPIEIHYESSDSLSEMLPSGAGTPSSRGATSQPTTNPTRIYRRCCQLRETPILKRVTEQLADAANWCPTTGIVNKLDLTDYYLQLADLVTLGDYLAVVPVRELVLENSGLGDEGVRVVLAGLLGARRPPGPSRRKKAKHDDQGGVVERLVLKNNKLGPDGWKHISLFLYMCRSLKYLDLSRITFPRQPPGGNGNNATLPDGRQIPRTISDIFAKALAERLGGPALEMLNIGETEPSMEQLNAILEGVSRCGVRRLGLAHNCLDERGVASVARFLAAGKCEGLDLGGNDLRHHMDAIAGALKERDPLWALSLAGCNLNQASLGKIAPALVRLDGFRFIDLSHNHELFQSTPSAVGMLRKFLPQMDCLKRIHLQDVNMTPDQAIAIIEVLPEVGSLAHINLLGNGPLVKLADARTEEAQEEACALYASLLAASRVSKSLICVDIEVPKDEAGEIVKAMAKQVVAYCLRNMERIPDTNISAAVASAMTETQNEVQESKLPAYPDVLVHLVGHDVLDEDERRTSDGGDDDESTAPDEDYVIGGTGVVKALTCCLENRGVERAGRGAGGAGEAGPEGEEGAGGERAASSRQLAAGGKAKDMSKHLLAGARKIRLRLQPALNRAKANPSDEQNLRKLTFLDETLQRIIKRFEDEFPDTREPAAVATSATTTTATATEAATATAEAEGGKAETGASGPSEGRPCGDGSGPGSGPPSSTSSPGPAAGEDSAVAVSDGEDESAIHAPKAATSRSNSMLSRVLAEEEGRMLRAGHRFRSGFVRQEQLDVLLNTIDAMSVDAKHTQMLTEMAEDLGGELLDKVREKGPVRAFKEDKEVLFRSMRESDPDHWERFIESQHKARANINVQGESGPAGDESAIAD